MPDPRVVSSARISKASTPRRRTLGFTLLEVLVALMIFAISSLALMRGMSQIVSQQERLEEKTFGNWIAENKVAEIRITKEFPAVGERKEDVEFAGRKWQLSETVTATPNLLMRKLELSVSLYQANDIGLKPVASTSSFVGAP